MIDINITVARLQYIGHRLSELLGECRAMDFVVQITDGHPEIALSRMGKITINDAGQYSFVSYSGMESIAILHDNEDFLLEHIVVHIIHLNEGLIYSGIAGCQVNGGDLA